MKHLFLFIVFPFFSLYSQNEDNAKVAAILDAWHKAAADANFNNYFDAMTEDAIFIGTDATENWTKTEFKAYAKPHFDNGKAWNFTAVERHIYLSKDKTLAWFDELLNTQMKICRGSGVLVRVKGQWKIQHYVLSMTVPNEVSDKIVEIKSPVEETLISEMKNKKK